MSRNPIRKLRRTSRGSETLHFRVSTGLKRVIGRDLITDDEVAIFELIKNSFDASATLVQLFFDKDSIQIVDNGDGMSLDDLKSKWLFVAYSAKRNDDASSRGVSDFRQQIAERRHYAGSKGIGRFSADRLGRHLVMQTCVRSNLRGTVHQLRVDWGLFERDETKQFATVPVQLSESAAFDLPPQITLPRHGTAIEIRDTRVPWERSRILHLKSSLAKLINPFGVKTDKFRIRILAPNEFQQDKQVRAESRRNGEEPLQKDLVNGEVGNFIFSTLREKTTFVVIELDEDGSHIISSLVDRGELVYKIREPNRYAELRDSGFRCELYYLNQSAKTTFSRRMGLASVRFGSVFLFRNGFRVFPIGEEKDDWFGIDRRKQQGVRRFLGTRDIIGRIDVSGPEDKFKEASSRNQGLILTPAVKEMSECFWDYCLKRLENYVVPVSWVDSAEKSSQDLSRLLTDSGRARVVAAVARLVDNADVEVLEYSRRLIKILNERSSQFEESLVGLRSIAEKTGDKELLAKLGRAEKRFDQLKAAEAEARRIAEEERAAREEAQREASEATTATKRVIVKLEEEKKRNLFLTSITSLDTQTILDMHHQITIYAADLKQQLENFFAAARGEELTNAEIVSRLEQISLLNQKILAISRVATKANFRLESDMIEADVADYIEQYINEVARPVLSGGMKINVQNDGPGLVKRFRPMEISIVVDNLISNSRKARASKISFKLEKQDKKTMLMQVVDDGLGLPEDLGDRERLFELGFSRTSGSGLGLYHVRQVLGEMGGSISVGSDGATGARFDVRISA